MMHPLDTPQVDVDGAAADSAAVLLDVREYQEWMAGRAPAARHLPMGELPSRLGELPREQRIICVCRSGNRSGQVTAWLCAQGYDAVNMAGGMQQWAARGLAVVNDNGNPGVVI